MVPKLYSGYSNWDWRWEIMLKAQFFSSRTFIFAAFYMWFITLLRTFCLSFVRKRVENIISVLRSSLCSVKRQDLFSELQTELNYPHPISSSDVDTLVIYIPCGSTSFQLSSGHLRNDSQTGRSRYWSHFQVIVVNVWGCLQTITICCKNYRDRVRILIRYSEHGHEGSLSRNSCV